MWCVNTFLMALNFLHVCMWKLSEGRFCFISKMIFLFTVVRVKNTFLNFFLFYKKKNLLTHRCVALSCKVVCTACWWTTPATWLEHAITEHCSSHAAILQEVVHQSVRWTFVLIDIISVCFPYFSHNSLECCHFLLVHQR